MTDGHGGSWDAGVRPAVYRGIAGAFAVFLFLFSPFSLLIIGWFADFEDAISHRVHEVSFGALFAVIFVGVLSQLGRPERQVAGLAQLVAATASLAIVVSASTGPEITVLAYVVPPIVLLAVHPDLGGVLRSGMRPMRGLLGALAFAAIPMIALAWSNFEKALDRVQGHESHWGAMAAFGVSILLVTAVAALRLPGWRLAAWSAGLAVAVYATVSLAFRFDASALAATQAIVALAWSVVVIVIAVRGEVGDSPVVRHMDDRLVAGVAAALSRRRGVSPIWIRMAFVLVPLAGPVAYLALWAILPAAPGVRPMRRPRLTPGTALVGVVILMGGLVLGPAGAAAGIPIAVLAVVVVSAMRLPATVGRRIVASAAGVGVAVAAALILGMWTSDRIFVTPVVPHQIERVDTSYCATCHVAGAARGAPIIDLGMHPYSDPLLGACVSCHDHLPVDDGPSAASWQLGLLPSRGEAGP